MKFATQLPVPLRKLMKDNWLEPTQHIPLHLLSCSSIVRSYSALRIWETEKLCLTVAEACRVIFILLNEINGFH